MKVSSLSLEEQIGVAQLSVLSGLASEQEVVRKSIAGRLKSITADQWKSIHILVLAAAFALPALKVPVAQASEAAALVGITAAATAGDAVANKKVDTGTVVGGVAGGVLGSLIGNGRGRLLSTGVFALIGAIAGHKYSADHDPKGQVDVEHDDDFSFAEAAFRQWKGKDTPSHALSTNPPAERAVSISSKNLKSSYDQYTSFSEQSKKQLEELQWAPSVAESERDQQISRMIKDRMKLVEQNYIVARGIFLDEASQAAKAGLDVRSFSTMEKYMTMDTPDESRHYVPSSQRKGLR